MDRMLRKVRWPRHVHGTDGQRLTRSGRLRKRPGGSARSARPYREMRFLILADNIKGIGAPGRGRTDTPCGTGF